MTPDETKQNIDDPRSMSDLLEELRLSCCKFMHLAFRLKLQVDREDKIKDDQGRPELEPIVNPWMKSPTE